MGDKLSKAATMMLEIHDGFMAGRDVDMEDAKIIALASAFGAQAFAVCTHRDAAPSAMTRAFLLALIDPMHPDLDYLRAQNVARLVSDETAVTIPAIDPAAIRDATLREALDAVSRAAWKHAGDDAFSSGMDAGATHQHAADRAAILALIGEKK